MHGHHSGNEYTITSPPTSNSSSIDPPTIIPIAPQEVTRYNSTQYVEESNSARNWLELLIKADEVDGAESNSAEYAKESSPVRDWLELLAKVDELPNTESDFDGLPSNVFNLRSGVLLTITDDDEPDQPCSDPPSGQLGSETNPNDYGTWGTAHRTAGLILGRAGVEFPADTPAVQWSTGLVTTLPFSGSREVRSNDLNNSVLEFDLGFRTRMR